MRATKLVIIAVILSLVQITFLAGWRPFGIVPNLLLILVISLSLNASSSEALWVALGGGVALDFASGTDFGIKAAVLVIVALFITWLRRGGTNLDSWWLELVLVAGGTVLVAATLLAALAVGHVAIPVVAASRQLGIEMVVNVLIAAAFRPMFISLLRQPMAILAVRGGL